MHEKFLNIAQIKTADNVWITELFCEWSQYEILICFFYKEIMSLMCALPFQITPLNINQWFLSLFVLQKINLSSDFTKN